MYIKIFCDASLHMYSNSKLDAMVSVKQCIYFYDAGR